MEKKFKLVSSENKLKDEQNEQNNTTSWFVMKIQRLFLPAGQSPQQI